ncbi:hypothetical protein RDI58_000504 [Solanum bulbocastanum]|uniref:Uncharacterized protein n=1 Tax=Solanum bulbocastanum TaxID=147425 RepID=A0AAN8UB40_SOLBU
MSIFASLFFVGDGGCYYLLLLSVFVGDRVDEGEEREGWGCATGGSLVSLARLASPELTGRSTGAVVFLPKKWRREGVDFAIERHFPHREEEIREDKVEGRRRERQECDRGLSEGR